MVETEQRGGQKAVGVGKRKEKKGRHLHVPHGYV